MSKCNYCKLKGYRRQAVKEGKRIVTLLSTEDSLGGINVYMIPKDETWFSDKEIEKYKISWLWEISDHCAC